MNLDKAQHFSISPKVEKTHFVEAVSDFNRPRNNISQAHGRKYKILAHSMQKFHFLRKLQTTEFMSFA
jgi:hypothetical protein